MKKKLYVAPEAEVLTFAKEDVITSSGPFDWDLPTVDLGGGNGDWEWSEDGDVLTLPF